jgi:scaffold protein (connect acetoacetyl-CoA thiolase and HMG-CoA synthase)
LIVTNRYIYHRKVLKKEIIVMEIPRHWRLKKQRYALVGEVCPHCDAKLFPPRDICPNCGQEARTEYQFSGKGEVFSYTTIYDAPAGYESQVPYTVALVKLEEGPMVTAQLTDLGNQKVEIGMPVEMVTRKLRSDGDERGIIVYGYKFRPSGLH